MQENIERYATAIRQSAADRTPLCIRAGGTKDFYGGQARGAPFAVDANRGIVDYEPTELVITARAGTQLAEIDRTLAEKGQMLGFEPPRFGATATLGGCIAAGLSGPRRPYAGSVRDFVLGIRMLDGAGRDLHFGGQVMKNVAGFDVSRLITGSLGTLGVVLEASLKVLPLPVAETTLVFEKSAADALLLANGWGGQPLPVSATAWHGGLLRVRLSGAAAAVEAAARTLGGERLQPQQADQYWRGVRDHTDAFFATPLPLWRLSVKTTAPPLNLPGPQLIEWGGALRWVATSAEPDAVRETAAGAGGHATLFRGGDKSVGVFQPLPPALMAIHRRLKQVFDPVGIFNPGRMYEFEPAGPGVRSDSSPPHAG